MVTPVAPFVGASDVGQEYTGQKTGDQGQGLNPGPIKKIVRKARGSNPEPIKKIVCKDQGFETWTDRQNRPGDSARDRQYDRERDQNTIASAIIKINVRSFSTEKHFKLRKVLCVKMLHVTRSPLHKRHTSQEVFFYTHILSKFSSPENFTTSASFTRSLHK